MKKFLQRLYHLFLCVVGRELVPINHKYPGSKHGELCYREQLGTTYFAKYVTSNGVITLTYHVVLFRYLLFGKKSKLFILGKTHKDPNRLERFALVMFGFIFATFCTIMIFCFLVFMGLVGLVCIATAPVTMSGNIMFGYPPFVSRRVDSGIIFVVSLVYIFLVWMFLI